MRILADFMLLIFKVNTAEDLAMTEVAASDPAKKLAAVAGSTDRTLEPAEDGSVVKTHTHFFMIFQNFPLPFNSCKLKCTLGFSENGLYSQRSYTHKEIMQIYPVSLLLSHLLYVKVWSL